MTDKVNVDATRLITAVNKDTIPKELIDMMCEASECRVKAIALTSEMKNMNRDNPIYEYIKDRHTHIMNYRMSLLKQIHLQVEFL